jgi:hypothetical protein
LLQTLKPIFEDYAQQGQKPDIFHRFRHDSSRALIQNRAFLQHVKLSPKQNRVLTQGLKGPIYMHGTLPGTNSPKSVPDERLAYPDFFQGRLTVF